MRSRTVRLVHLAAAALAVAALAVPAAAQSGSCAAIGGLQSVSMTTDDGATWAPNRRPFATRELTAGLAPLSTPGEIVAEYSGTIYRSVSGGCRWSPIGTVPTSPLHIVAGGGTQAWAFGFFAGRDVWRIDTSATGPDRVALRTTIPAGVLTIAVDPFDADHLRAVGDNGIIYETFDGAGRWSPIGRGAPVGPLTYFAAVDPQDLDRVMIGTINDGVFTTQDGGATWEQAKGLSLTAGRVNGFYGVFSRTGDGVAWVLAYDLDAGGRRVSRSTDGGLTFAPAIEQANGVILNNSTLLTPHPTDSDIVYFPFGSIFAEGMWLYRHDAATGTTTFNFSTDWVSPRALAIPDWAPGTILGGFEGI